VLADPQRSILDGLEPPPRSTDTTARLQRALDDVDHLVAARRPPSRRAAPRPSGR
jgi:hypothetical protein